MGSGFPAAANALFDLLGVTGGASGVTLAFGFRGVVEGGLIGLTGAGGFLTKGTVPKLCSVLFGGVGVVDRVGRDLKRPLLPPFFVTALLLSLLLGGLLRFFWSLFLLVGVLASILFLATGPRSHCGCCCSSISFCTTGGVGGEFPSPLLQDELSWLTVLR